MNHYQKGFVIPLIITVIAVLAIGGVVYFTPEKKVGAPMVPVSVDTSDWKTYKNEKYGFEIKYPSTWVSKLEINKETITYSIERDGYALNIVSNKELICQKYFIKEDSKQLNLIGDKVYRQQKPDAWEEGGGLYFEIVLPNHDCYIKNGDISYMFSYSLPNTATRDIFEEDKVAEMDKILSTFKFTTPTVKPTPATSTQPIACTMDAMMCPDGSYVGRSGPKCEFVCPVKEKCSIPLAYDDKANTSISCVEGTYTPDQVIALAEKLNGNQIEIRGYISSQLVPGFMPTGGPAFHTSTGNIFMNGVSGVYGADKNKQMSVRGVFSYNGKDNYFLTIPIYCKNCVKTILN